jgi:hypothetical protein
MDNSVMTVHVVSSSLQLERLIAEAKGRAKRRRLALAAAAIIVGAVTIAVTLAVRPSGAANVASVGSHSTAAAQPPARSSRLPVFFVRPPSHTSRSGCHVESLTGIRPYSPVVEARVCFLPPSWR